MLYGIIANINMEKLLVAGILPGICRGRVLGLRRGWVGVEERLQQGAVQRQRAWRALWLSSGSSAIPVVLLGGLAPAARLHEAAALTALYVLFIEVFVYKDIASARICRASCRSMTLVGAILMIMAWPWASPRG